MPKMKPYEKMTKIEFLKPLRMSDDQEDPDKGIGLATKEKPKVKKPPLYGIYTCEVAETKVTQVMDLAQLNEHPLQCTMEKE